MTGEAPRCRICASTELRGFDTREMMFGIRDTFTYQECLSCGCVQIAEIPSNLQKYYPAGYHPSTEHRQDRSPLSARVIDFAKQRLVRSATIRNRFLKSDATQRWISSRPAPFAYLYLKHVPDQTSKILDVGCGNGILLKDLHYLYYRNISGVDPFIDGDISFNGRILVKKANLSDLSPAYDCVSFHHVLEHMPDQKAALEETRRLLAPNGLAIIRIPVVGGFAWREYQPDWVQLDPPRHLYLHSERSFTLTANQAGFDVVSIEYDSTGLQFWGSELYRRDIALKEPGSPWGPSWKVDILDRRNRRLRRASSNAERGARRRSDRGDGSPHDPDVTVTKIL